MGRDPQDFIGAATPARFGGVVPPEEPPLRAEPGTSRLAVLAGFFACLCPTGIGGLLGVALGILGLREIAASRGQLGGSTMAWLGIALGLVQTLLAGTVISRMQADLDQAPAAVATFFGKVCANDRPGAAAAMSRGLRAAMEDRRNADLPQRLTEALGGFEGLGARGPHHFRWAGSSEELSVQYALRFSKGAPAWAECALVRQEGAMRLRSVSVRSPLLRKAIEVEAPEGREIGDWAGPKAAKGRKELREFRPQD